MPHWRDARVQEIRSQLTPADVGSPWILYLHDLYAEPVLAAAFDDAMAHMDRELAENVAMIISKVGAKAVLLAVPRPDGMALAGDRQLWAELHDLLADSPTELADLLVIGRARYWSAERRMRSRSRRAPPSSPTQPCTE